VASVILVAETMIKALDALIWPSKFDTPFTWA
jgi:hypothetical protein